MKATFYERIGAYLIDLIIISIIASIITSVVPSKNTSISTDISNLTNSYASNEISSSDYLEKYQNLLYENTKDNMNENIVSLVITIAYYIVFAYLNKGKTIGKLALNLKVVDVDTEKETGLINFIIRGIIPFGILTSTVSLITINVLNKKTYLSINNTLSVIETLFIIATLISIIVRKDNRGLHDLMAKTKVIKQERR